MARSLIIHRALHSLRFDCESHDDREVIRACRIANLLVRQNTNAVACKNVVYGQLGQPIGGWPGWQLRQSGEPGAFLQCRRNARERRGIEISHHEKIARLAF